MQGHTYKNCKICGRLELLHNAVDSCSHCREIVCLQCGDKYVVRGKKDGDKKFCSLSCAAKYRSNKTAKKVCKRCDVSVDIKFNSKYCFDCNIFLKKEQDKKYREKNIERLKQKKKDYYNQGNEYVCKTCSKKFNRNSYRTKIPKFCSKKCSDNESKKTRVKSGNPSWKKGKASQTYNKYYAEWVYKNKGLLLEEIGCEVCGIMSGTIFDRHHIIFKSEAGFDENINNPLNIVQVCRSCHLKFHSKELDRSYLVKERGLKNLFKSSKTVIVYGKQLDS